MGSRQQLLGATIDLVDQIGLDRVTMSSIGRDAQVSRGTLYTNFESPESAMAEVWLELGDEWLRGVSKCHTTSITPTQHRALIDAFFTAPRRPELLEVVRPVLLGQLAEALAMGSRRRDRWVWQMSLGLGASILAESGLPGSPEHVQTVVTALCDYPDGDHQGDPRALPQFVESPLPLLPQGEEIEDRLLRATATVVANAGVAGTSMLRVCRLARLTPGAFPNHFSSLTEAVLKSFRTVLDRVIDQDRQDYFNTKLIDKPSDEIARLLVSAMRPSRELWRKLCREMMVEARRNDDVRDAMIDALNAVDDIILRDFVQLGIDELTGRRMLTLHRAFTVGFTILAELGVDVSHVDHASIIEWGLTQIPTTSN
jgi:AcrR family transcriptional regulator